MSLVPYQPFFDFDQLWKNMKLSLDQDSSSILSPKIEVAEKDNQYMISAEFPGVTSDDIDIRLEKGILTLSAETQYDKEKEEGKVIYQERRYGKFSRSFNVGQNINEEEIKASFKDGVLTLNIPKKAETEEHSKKIPIHS
jgi:HSP20 family protein